MRTIETGNHFRRAFALAEDATLRGGNWTLANITLNGHALHLEPGGNYRGLRVDGMPLDASAPPAGVTVAPGVATFPGYVFRRHEPLPEAVSILRALQEAGGADALEAWLWDVAYILGAPAGVTLAQWRDAHAAFADATGNLIYSMAAFRRSAAFLLAKTPGEVGPADWAPLVSLIRAHSLETWRGEPTELAEEVA